MKKDLRGTEVRLSANYMFSTYIWDYFFCHFEKFYGNIKVVVYTLISQVGFCFLDFFAFFFWWPLVYQLHYNNSLFSADNLKEVAKINSIKSIR